MSSTKKVYVMTGGNIGIGFECAKLIVAQPNVHLILGCRDTQRGAAGVKNLEPFLANGSTVEHKPLDLATFASVRKFATELAESQPQGIHTLILNAGLMVFSRRMTVDNFETNLQVNHLSQFLLVQLLLPLLRKGHATWPEEPSCITFVSSSLHQPGTGRGKGPELTIENIDGSKEFDGMVMYRNSKLCQLLCMFTLAASLENDEAINVNAVCPGFIPTTDLKRDSGLATRVMMDNVLSRISAASTVTEGGERVFKAFTEGRAKNGGYFSKGEESQSSDESHDAEKQQFWWKWSSDVVGL
ncbi:hypothetical protein BG006_003204 [Podila minutissima]|uniref:Protochlorophyllide reductase n=1 Tax=Podila minutissima TaxID=64525 RepID=A0A9P5VNM4_9FUNG|nr:hypothetical protein BG006_003204 [Podila minutissima]